MRKFIDLHLRVPIKDPNKVERAVRKSYELGYRLVGIVLPPRVTRDQIKLLKNLCNDTNVDLVTRVNFSPKTPRELLHDLRRFRRKFEIISVTCTSKGVAKQAAKDRRVDLINFPATGLRRRFFDDGEAELASRALSSLEIEMAPLLLLTGFSRIRLISCLRREVAIAERYKVPVTISSGATNEYLIRSPHDYTALTSLFDMSMSCALRALSGHPFAIVKRNREKLSLNYVAPGIRVVGRKDFV